MVIPYGLYKNKFVKFLNRKYSIKFTPTQNNNNVRCILFKLPYIGNASINFEKKLKTLAKFN